VSNRTGTGGVHLYDPATGRIVRLSPAGAYDEDPVISPGGDRIAFANFEAGGRFRLMTMAVDGSDRRLCTDQADVSDTGPRWAPDGRRLVFTRTGRASGTRGVCTILASGESLVVVTTDGNPRALDWSPDGHFLLFFRDTTLLYGVAYDLRTIRPDGTGVRSVFGSPDAYPFVGAEYSPDGSRIATTQAGGPSPYVEFGNADGTRWTRFTTDLAPDGVGRPSWSPDGGSIVFSGRLSLGTDDLFSVLVTAPYEVLPLLEGPAWDSSPHWGPRP
jgi:Tol biopolymer transport system component